MKKITEGQVASEISARGRFYFTEEELIPRAKKGEATILIKYNTTPEDTIAIEYSKGVVTAVGGLISHAAITAREFGKASIINCPIGIDLIRKELVVGDERYPEGTEIFLNSETGGIYLT